MKPIYLPADSYKMVQSGPVRESKNQGKVTIYRDYILINEKLEGIHVIDNSDPNNPEKIVFWEIPGNINYTVDGEVIYADNGLNLLVIDVSDIYNIYFESLVPNHVTGTQNLEVFPQDYTGWFHCFKQGNGVLVGWERGDLVNPKCRINL